MTYKCNVLFVPGHRAPVVRGNHVGSPPFLRRVCTHTAARVPCVYAHAVAIRMPYPGPGTEAASAFLLYYV